MKLALGLLIFLGTNAFAKEKLTCTAKELAGQDCRLYSGSYNLRLLAKTIAWTDGTWHVVDPMPLNGEAIEWEKVSFGHLKDWPVLQLWLWDKGTGEAQVESLHWIVSAVENQKISLLNEGIVRKRHPEAPPDPAPGAKPAPPPKTKFIYDSWEPFSLKPLKNGDLEWELSGVKKVLSRKKL